MDDDGGDQQCDFCTDMCIALIAWHAATPDEDKWVGVQAPTPVRGSTLPRGCPQNAIRPVLIVQQILREAPQDDNGVMILAVTMFFILHTAGPQALLDVVLEHMIRDRAGISLTTAHDSVEDGAAIIDALCLCWCAAGDIPLSTPMLLRLTTLLRDAMPSLLRMTILGDRTMRALSAVLDCWEDKDGEEHPLWSEACSVAIEDRCRALGLEMLDERSEECQHSPTRMDTPANSDRSRDPASSSEKETDRTAAAEPTTARRYTMDTRKPALGRGGSHPSRAHDRAHNQVR